MHIDYISVYERLKNEDISWGGDRNLAIKDEIEPYINFADENEKLSYQYLLVQYEFYIFHALKCMELLKKQMPEESILEQGYTSFEIDTARQLTSQYGDEFKKNKYLYMANLKMGLVAHTICLILEDKPLTSIPMDVVESAKRRLEYASSN